MKGDGGTHDHGTYLAVRECCSHVVEVGAANNSTLLFVNLGLHLIEVERCAAQQKYVLGHRLSLVTAPARKVLFPAGTFAPSEGIPRR